MAATKLKTYSIDVELTAEQARAIGPDGAKIQAVAEQAAREIADGGWLLSAKSTQQLAGILYGKGQTEQEIVNYVAAGVGRKNGSITVEWVPDASYVPVLEELAQSRGLPVKDIAQDILDYAVGSGWMYSVSPDAVTCFFTRPQAEAIRQYLGKTGHFTGQELIDALLGLSAKAA